MTNIAWSDKSDGDGTTATTRVSAADMNEVKAAVNSKEDAHVLIVTTAAATTLALANDRAIFRFTNAAPVLTIPAQTTVTFPTGFYVEGYAPSGMTITAAAGVTLNGVSAGSQAIGASTSGAGFRLVRDASNAWTVQYNATAAHTHTVAQITDFSAGTLALFGTPVSSLLATSALSAPTAIPMVDGVEATAYHLVAGNVAGMLDQGKALDRWLHGAMTLTPVAGDLNWLWPINPAGSLETPEVALTQANRPSNAEVSLTSATSDANTVRIIFPEPTDAATLAGIERRSLGHRLVNNDPYATIAVTLGAPAVGRLTAQWRGALADFNLTPGDEAHVWGRVRAGELDFDQIIRAAVWATIAPVAGSGDAASGNTRNVLNVLAGDLIVAAVTRTDGQSIVTPTGRGWVEASGTVFNAGRLLNTGRATKIVWAFATTSGTFNTGAFTNGNRIWAAAFRNVASVGRVAGAAAIDTSLAYPSLTSPLAPKAHVIGFTSRIMATHAKPTSSTVVDTNTVVDSGSGAATSGAMWTMGEVTSHAPAALTQTSAAWESAAIELIPRRIS
jgi:hypothetical protein